METLVVEAIYQQGVIKPLEPLDLGENQRLQVTIEPARPDGLSLAADDPCGAFSELDLAYEVIEAITRSSWESKVKELASARNGSETLHHHVA